MLGAGTVDSPYLISTPSDLQAINNNLSAYYELANDIEMTGISFIPIGRTYPFFQGHIDGKGYKISNLKVIDNSTQYTGFIARTNGGDIKNIGLENVYIESNNDDVGGLVGLNSLSNFISNCYVTGTVKQTNTSKNYVGGLIGRNLGLVENCFTDCTVSGGNSVGGLIGWTIDFNPTYYIRNSYTKSTVSGVSKVGAFIGDQGTTTIFENDFYNSDLSSNPVVSGIIGKSSTEMQQQSTYTGWDFGTTWYMDGYPALRVFAGDMVMPKVETVTVDSYINLVFGNSDKQIKSTKQLNSYSNTIQTNTERHTATLRNISTYLSQIQSNAIQSHRTVRTGNRNVSSFILPINSFVNRESKIVKELLTHIKPLEANISVLYPLVDIPIYAYSEVIQNPSSVSEVRNMSDVSYVLNPSEVEVI